MIWEFRFNQGCRHVNFIARGNVPGEQEFLLTAYSVFTVLPATEIKQHPSTFADPHKVVLEVAPDNLNLGEDLPVSAWFFFNFYFKSIFFSSFFLSFLFLSHFSFLRG